MVNLNAFESAQKSIGARIYSGLYCGESFAVLISCHRANKWRTIITEDFRQRWFLGFFETPCPKIQCGPPSQDRETQKQSDELGGIWRRVDSSGGPHDLGYRKARSGFACAYHRQAWCQPIYSDIAIEPGLALRLVLHQLLRQTESALRSITDLLGVGRRLQTSSRRGGYHPAPLNGRSERDCGNAAR